MAIISKAHMALVSILGKLSPKLKENLLFAQRFSLSILMSICAFAISMWIEIYTVKYNAHIPLALEFIIINFAFIFGVLGIKHWADYLRLKSGNSTAATENGNTM
jgi:large-conductance mechanosensitive channel